MTIAVLYGGKSGEHEISLMSGAAIARNIGAGHRALLIGITKDGRWFLQGDDELERVRADKGASLRVSEREGFEVSVVPGMGMRALKAGGEELRVDVAFPALHGANGEDGTVQGLLEMADIPYVGFEPMASALSMDKEKTKAIWDSRGLPIVPYITMRRADLLDSDVYDKIVRRAAAALGYPLFVKPCRAGSSNGASRAKNEKELSYALMEAFRWDDKALIEQAIDARELECAVLGNSVTAPADSPVERVRVYGPGEIMLTHDFYDYNAKYNDSDGVKIPADIPLGAAQKIREMAESAYKAVDGAGFARVDFFYDKYDGEIYLNEINSIPGFTDISMFPKLCEFYGLDFPSLIDTLVKEAAARYKSHAALLTSR